MKNWQFNVLFFVGVGGAILLLLGPELGLNINQNPTAFTGIGAILTYILTQRKVLTKHDFDDDNRSKNTDTRSSSEKVKQVMPRAKRKETEEE